MPEIGAQLAWLRAMKSGEVPDTDMMTLARLHAALDAVTDTEQIITHIRQSSAISRPAMLRVGQLVAEARELLRSMLSPPGALAVGTSPARRASDGW
jgi:hypothetical protein